MGKDTLKYIALCMLVYLGMTSVEFFVLDPLIDFVCLSVSDAGDKSASDKKDREQF